MWQKIDKSMFQQTKWAGGTTTQMAIWPENGDYSKRDFIYRISQASVELESSTFTPLEGVNRHITTTEGELKLRHEGGEWHTLLPFDVYRFNGGLHTEAMGLVKDFNLMTKGSAEGEMLTIRLCEGEVYERASRGMNSHLWLYIAEGQTEEGTAGDFFSAKGSTLRVHSVTDTTLIICQIDLE